MEGKPLSEFWPGDVVILTEIPGTSNMTICQVGDPVVVGLNRTVVFPRTRRGVFDATGYFARPLSKGETVTIGGN